MTGVRHALARGLQDREAVAEVAGEYVRTSAPDAITALRPGPQELIKLADAKLQEWRPGHAAGAFADAPGAFRTVSRGPKRP